LALGFGNLRFRHQVFAIMVIIVAVALGGTAMIARPRAMEAYRQKTFGQLASTGQIKASWIADEFRSYEGDLEMGGAAPEIATSILEQIRTIAALDASSPGGSGSSRVRAAYVEDNPFPPNQRAALDGSTNPSGTPYDAIHHRDHAAYRQYAISGGYADILLVDPDTGRVVYSVTKDTYFLESLGDPPWVNGGLGRCFRRIRDNPGTPDNARIVFEDFESVGDDPHATPAYMGTALFHDARFVGVLINRLSIRPINEIMLHREGLGETGETYLVGPDFLMRSEPRVTTDSTVLTTRVETAPVLRALKGEHGQGLETDYRGRRVFCDWRPIEVGAVRWAVVSQIDEDEALVVFEHQLIPMIQWCVVLFVLLMIMSYLFARRVDRPIAMLVRGARNMSEGQCGMHVAKSESAHEFIELVDTFNEMAERVCAHTEVLERARQEAEHSSLEAAHANRAKSEFLANMSHELRTPLNGVLGYVQILQRDRTLTADQRECLASIESCGEHLLTLINDVLDLSKIEAGRIEVVNDACDLERMITAVCSVIDQRASEKGVQLVRELDPTLPRAIVTDQTKLRQVLVNLLGNAAKFTDAGQVTLTVSELPAGRLEFVVSDTGIGIEADKLEEIFDPFKQAKAATLKGGTGLGLAISRRLVEALGGYLGVESTVGQGSRFWFSIPLTEAETVAAPVEGEADQAAHERTVLAAGQDVTVLVADDRQANRDILVRLLREAGFGTIEAADGQEALDVLREHRPALVFLDIRMPVMDGLEATRRIREDADLNSTVIIAVSASVFQESQQQIFDAGCDDFLGKPLRAGEVFAKIAKHLAVRFAEPETEPDEPAESEADACLPPDAVRDVTRRLRQAVEIGNVTELNAIASELSALTGPCVACGGRIAQLAKAFDFDGLLALADAWEAAAADPRE